MDNTPRRSLSCKIPPFLRRRCAVILPKSVRDLGVLSVSRSPAFGIINIYVIAGNGVGFST